MKIPREVVLQLAKGFTGRSKNCYKLAYPKVIHWMRQDFYTRLKRKRRFRVYWMSKINIASREWNLTYAHLTCGLRHANIWIDRKNLCTLAETEPVSFKALVDEAKRLYYVQASKPRNIEDL